MSVSVAVAEAVLSAAQVKAEKAKAKAEKAATTAAVLKAKAKADAKAPAAVPSKEKMLSDVRQAGKAAGQYASALTCAVESACLFMAKHHPKTEPFFLVKDARTLKGNSREIFETFTLELGNHTNPSVWWGRFRSACAEYATANGLWKAFHADVKAKADASEAAKAKAKAARNAKAKAATRPDAPSVGRTIGASDTTAADLAKARETIQGIVSRLSTVEQGIWAFNDHMTAAFRVASGTPDFPSELLSVARQCRVIFDKYQKDIQAVQATVNRLRTDK